jgi:hypothetical protein
MERGTGRALRPPFGPTSCVAVGAPRHRQTRRRWEREGSSRRCQTCRQPRRHGRAAQDPAEGGEGRRRARGGGPRRRKRAGLEQIQVVVPELGRRAALGHGPAPPAMDAAEGAGEPATPRFLASSPPGAPPFTHPQPTTSTRGRGRP